MTKEQQITVNDLFIDAADNGKLFFVKFFIGLGADIHFRKDFALRRASHRGYFDVVKYLVEHGADIQACYNYAIKYAATQEIKEYLESKI